MGEHSRGQPRRESRIWVLEWSQRQDREPARVLGGMKGCQEAAIQGLPQAIRVVELKLVRKSTEAGQIMRSCQPC